MQASHSSDAILFLQAYKQSGLNPKAIFTIGGGFNDAALSIRWEKTAAVFLCAIYGPWIPRLVNL
jgi:hypothetical protein